MPFCSESEAYHLYPNQGSFRGLAVIPSINLGVLIRSVDPVIYSGTVSVVWRVDSLRVQRLSLAS